ncbi:hypothetical protein [Novosphingobium sp. KN65.2]|uniref:hypothetical protein n=1 Tax=Novosphingobium sp. KN65.2 TaxID=1478134 RepID=UPI0005E822BC|nr:hypothetical protein [Novosphingobium sp. KN65.2]CDO34090.1 hypothetical protein SPHV1_1030003 [Novosphingobium sp. KN65.2]
MTTPSKAAIERANEYLGGCFPVSNGAMRAFATYIDTVDRVAREVDSLIANGSFDTARHDLKVLRLPDEPDPLAKALEDTFGDGFGTEAYQDSLRTALTAAGLKIVKDEG